VSRVVQMALVTSGPRVVIAPLELAFLILLMIEAVLAKVVFIKQLLLAPG